MFYVVSCACSGRQGCWVMMHHVVLCSVQRILGVAAASGADQTSALTCKQRRHCFMPANGTLLQPH